MPTFTKKQLETETETEAPKKKKRPAHKKTVEVEVAEVSELDQKMIDQKLTKIYEDSSGNLPDMKKFKIKKSNRLLKSLMYLIVFGVLLSGAAWAGFIMMPPAPRSSADLIEFSIRGPEKVELGATSTYFINFANNQSVAMRNVTLSVRYPAEFVFSTSSVAAQNQGHTEWKWADLDPGDEGEVRVSGVMYGTPGDSASWRIFLKYQPENQASELQKMALLSVKLNDSPVSLALTGPAKATVGDKVEFAYSLTNGQDALGVIELRPLLPANFTLTSSSPALQIGSLWKIVPATSTESNLNSQFKIQGKFTSVDANQTEAVIGGSVYLAFGKDKQYKIAEATSTVELAQNTLDFSVAINGSLTDFAIQPGNILNATVHVKNVSREDMNNAALKLIFEAPSANNKSILDWATINDSLDGDIRGQQVSSTIRRGQIAWTGAHSAALKKIKPNDQINIDARLPIKSNEQTTLSDFSASQIKVTAELNYKDKGNNNRTISTSPLYITLNSDTKFEVRDEISEVGGGNKHSLTWILNNNFHPLKNITIVADVFGDVTWGEDATAPAGEARYDAANKKITWTVAEMPESVDVLALNFNLTLNNANPTQNLLVSKPHLTAEDAVTGQIIDLQGEETKFQKQIITKCYRGDTDTQILTIDIGY